MPVAIQKQLLNALEKIDRPGTFCTSGRLQPIIPGLRVTGVGAVSLPLGKRQAASLKRQARQAPYGKGEQTLVDTGVRRVWEIDASQVTLANREWLSVVEEAVRETQRELGLEKQKLSAHLYKLLLYEPGSFFLSHRDGEKLDGMVATLVISLPSAHEGGDLVVRHDGQEKIIAFGGPESQFHTQFAAFYADCEHEIRPLESGFRLALIYNLALTRSKRKITAPTNSEHVTAVGRILGQWKRRSTAGPSAPSRSSGVNAPPKLAVLLNHEYTKAGLAFDALKGIDRARAHVLFEAARQGGCDAYLALVTKWQSGSAEPSGGYGSSYSRYEYDPYDDYDDDYEMGEIIEESLTAENFIDSDGKRPSFGQIPLVEDELVSKEPITDGDPNQEEFEGYTGNEGMTLDRWYHCAAVLLWPAEARFDVLCEAGIESAVGGLEQMVKQWKRAKKSERAAVEEQCRQFAQRIIAHWPAREFAQLARDDNSATAAMLASLESLGDTSLIAAWLRGVLAKDVTVEPGKLLGNLCSQHDWLTFHDELRDLFQSTSHETVERNAQLLADWSLRRDKNAERKNLCSQLAGDLMSFLLRWNAHRGERDWRAKTVDRSALLASLARSFLALEEGDVFERLVTYVRERPKEFDLTTVQVPALLGLQPWLKRKVRRPCPPLRRWLEAVNEELAFRAAHPPQEPLDWRRESAIGCKCADCREVSRFLDDPDTPTLRFPLAKERRRHLHQIIEQHRLDLTHVTERRGRPFTLICTKTKASYKRALSAHQVDLEHFQKISNIQDWHETLA